MLLPLKPVVPVLPSTRTRAALPNSAWARTWCTRGAGTSLAMVGRARTSSTWVRSSASHAGAAVAGDFFKAVPPGGDAYIMKHIIHDWDDERASVILRNIRTALAGKPRAKVILLEGVIQAGNAPDLMKLIDLEMLMMPGGRERTADEYRALFARSGFEMTRIVPTQSPLSVIEAVPSR